MSVTSSSVEPRTALPANEPLRAILQSGILAPSADNRHHFRFELSADHVALVSTDTSTWVAQPHRRMLGLVSYGAVLENMALRAAQLGLAQATRWMPDTARADLIAECRWTAAPAVEEPLAAAIDERHSNRRFFRRRSLDAALLARLAAAAGAVPGATLLWLDDPDRRRVALQALRIAETERFCRPALHQELFGAVRFDAGWHAGTTLGLPPGALEVEPPMRPAFAALRRWPLMHALTRIGMHHLLGLRAADLPCRLAPHLGLIVCDLADPRLAALYAGRALERVWLAATAARLALQPMAAASALVHQRAGGGWVAPAAQRRLIERLDRLTDGRPRAAFMFVRVGRAAPPSVTAGRPPLDQFLTR
ncbi:MAG TPA: hypothetical protein VJ743_14775 [Albitalea sp.]|nr:hypothetical protein [Albitalea sp.]